MYLSSIHLGGMLKIMENISLVGVMAEIRTGSFRIQNFLLDEGILLKYIRIKYRVNVWTAFI
jgi:molybdopterin synthase catalytic subunit